MCRRVFTPRNYIRNMVFGYGSGLLECPENVWGRAVNKNVGPPPLQLTPVVALGWPGWEKTSPLKQE